MQTPPLRFECNHLRSRIPGPPVHACVKLAVWNQVEGTPSDAGAGELQQLEAERRIDPPERERRRTLIPDAIDAREVKAFEALSEDRLSRVENDITRLKRPAAVEDQPAAANREPRRRRKTIGRVGSGDVPDACDVSVKPLG